jgi:MarR-like DNA-binding transcriptional regulator SgrR of sgrS sRNA
MILALSQISNASQVKTNDSDSREVRTYLSFSYPVDPAKVITLTDLDLSYALASTLVEWNDGKEITAGLSDHWEVLQNNVFRFRLRKDVKWSDGSPITAADLKKSFERSRRLYSKKLQGLYSIVDSINESGNNQLDFKLNVSAKTSGLLKKLTEPMYGVVRVDKKGKLVPEVGSGPYVLESHSATELSLTRNSQWHRFDKRTINRVLIRKSPTSRRKQDILLKDSWPSILEFSSLMENRTLRQYRENNFEIWRRNLDKAFILLLGKRITNSTGYDLLRYLRKNMKRSEMVRGFTGYQLADQLFPKGYVLYDSDSLESESKVSLPKEFKNRPIDVLIVPGGVAGPFKRNVSKAIADATGQMPNFIETSLSEVNTHFEKGDFDVFIGTLAVTDPNYEGALSFFLEGSSPPIPSGKEDFVGRFRKTRRLSRHSKKELEYRSLMSEVVRKGHILPLFHVSTIVVARGNLDLSAVPTSDESVSFSKIRLKNVAKRKKR